MKTHIEVIRERNIVRFDPTLTLDHFVEIIIRRFAPDYIVLDLTDEEREAFQWAIDAALWGELGNTFTACALRLIDSGALVRARRSWRGKPVALHLYP